MELLTIDDPETKSADVVAENVEALKALFPEAFTEGRIDFEVLKQLLGSAVAEREEKYGLNWHGKRRARQIALTPSTGTLLPCPEDSVDWDTTQNLMIEGDNLEVLKLLQKSYAGKVKLIYIDPPYNTGKDFIYADDFRDSIRNYLDLTGQVDGTGRKLSTNTEASGRFHTEWLNMMYPRMKLARNLLDSEGVILISVDDHEIENLRRICNEVFGEENFIANMIWEKGRKNDARLLSVGHEYVLVYAKSLWRLREAKAIWREAKPGAREIWEKYLELRRAHGSNNDLIETHLQAWYSSLPRAHPAKKWSRYKRVDANGPWRDHDISWPGGGGPRYEVLHPRTKQPCKIPEDGWRFSKPEEMQRQIRMGLVEFREDHTEPPFRKAHIRPVAAEIETELEGEEDGALGNNSQEDLAAQVRGSYFYKQSQVAVKFLRGLLGSKAFNNPKDHVELAKLFDYVTASDTEAIVMDFFAGSGSTGHAVMDLNQNDGGHRRFVLVQLPEPLDTADKEQEVAADYCDQLGKPRNIAELTKERLRRAGEKIKEKNPMFAGDLGFRVFKLATSNIRAWEPEADNIEESLLRHSEHLMPGRSEQDVLYELLLKLGLDLCVPIQARTIAGKSVHSIGGGALIVCLANSVTRELIEELANGIVAWRNELAPAVDTRVVFKDFGFADDVAKTNIAAILNQNGIADVRSL